MRLRTFENALIGKMAKTNLLFLLFAAMLLIISCATPKVEQLSRTEILQPDEEDNLGGTFFESGDIRTIASKMSAAILSTQAINGHPGIVYIAISPIRNNTRFVVDNDIFISRLRIELNKVAKEKIRFFSQNVGQEARSKILQERSGAAAIEESVETEGKLDSGLAKSDYILTGELSGLSKAAEGAVRSDYLIMSFQLVDPITNEVLWEDAYETKKKSGTSVLYR
jgi:PBP1b-binding outer membrane lipoprotein LpoB